MSFFTEDDGSCMLQNIEEHISFSSYIAYIAIRSFTTYT